MCRGWPQMLSSHWHSLLFGPGSYCTTPPWRQCWSFCVSTRPVSPQVCVCVFFSGILPVCVSHTHLGLRATLSSPPVTTEQHCVSLSTTRAACLPVTIDMLSWQHVSDQDCGKWNLSALAATCSWVKFKDVQYRKCKPDGANAVVQWKSL